MAEALRTSFVAIATWFSRPIIFHLNIAALHTTVSRQLHPSDFHARDRLLAPRVGGRAAGGAADTLGQLLLLAAARIVAPRRVRDGLAYARMHRVGNALEENGRIGGQTPALVENQGDGDQTGEAHGAAGAG